MDLMQLAKQLVTQFSDSNNDGQVDMNEAITVFSRLFAGSAASGTSLNSGGGIDLGGLVAKMQGSGLSDIVGSWLGDGANQAISGQQITDILGQDKVSDFASSMNMDVDSAQDQLAELVPQIVDKSSSGGQLNDLLSAAGGIEGIAAGLGKLFANRPA